MLITLLKDPIAKFAGLILLALYVSAALADFLAPYPMNFSDRNLANAPPTIIRIVDRNGTLTFPYVFRLIKEFNPATFEQKYVEVMDKSYSLTWLTNGAPYKLFGVIPSNLHLFGVKEPARLFLLGSDIAGRDNFSRLFFGAQKSLTIGFLSLLVTFPIGIIYGGISGFLGGRIDSLMMRITEAIMSIPSFYLLLSLAAVLPPHLSSSQRFALITIILSFIEWATLARVIRGLVLSIKSEDFVQAALASGMSEFNTILRHVIPQTASFIIVSATLQVPHFILSESGLSFIGLGIQEPDASWGNMLKSALDNAIEILDKPWLLAPGFLIFVSILCFNTIGDVLRDHFDPRLRT